MLAVAAFGRVLFTTVKQFIVRYVLCKLFNSINCLYFLCLLIVALTSPARARVRSRYPNERSRGKKSEGSHRSAAGVRIHSEAREKRKRWNSAWGESMECQKQFVVFTADILTLPIGQWTKWKQHSRHSNIDSSFTKLHFHSTFSLRQRRNKQFNDSNSFTKWTQRNIQTFVHHLSATRQASARRRQIVFTLAANIRCINLHTRNERRGQTNIVKMKLSTNGSQNTTKKQHRMCVCIAMKPTGSYTK